MAGLATRALSGNAWGTREPFLLAESAETGAEAAEYYAGASPEPVFVSALSAPVSALSASI